MLQSNVRPRIPEESGAKIPMTLPQTEDAPRIPKADNQRNTKKVRWRKMKEDPDSK